MTGQDMLDAIVYLNPALIEEADDDMPQVKKASPIKRWGAIAACLALLLSASIGSIAAEAKEYKAAMQFFDEYTLPTEGLTRGEIKAVYHDITNKSFVYEKTANVIESSLTPEQKVEYAESRGDANDKNAQDLWDYKIKNTATEPVKEVVKSGFTYKILVENPGGYTLTACDKSIAGTLVIPETINGLPVVAIGYYAFSNCKNLTSVIIPEGVTTIVNGAFASCENLASITIPETVTIIGTSAFASCKSLMSVTLPDSVTRIGDHAFSGCSNLTSISMAKCIYIGHHAFHGCSNLTSIIISASLNYIGRFAFDGCDSLWHVLNKSPREQTYNLVIDSYNNHPFANATLHFDCTDDVHISFEVTRQPACNEFGTKAFYCSICGTTELKLLDPVAHNFGPWTQVKAATAGSAGLEERICIGCGTKEQRTVTK